MTCYRYINSRELENPTSEWTSWEEDIQNDYQNVFDSKQELEKCKNLLLEDMKMKISVHLHINFYN